MESSPAGGATNHWGPGRHCCFSWDLAEREPAVFGAQGREPFWYHSVDLAFELDGSAATAVTISFEEDDPPRFVRDRDVNNPPAPPELCE